MLLMGRTIERDATERVQAPCTRYGPVRWRGTRRRRILPLCRCETRSQGDGQIESRTVCAPATSAASFLAVSRDADLTTVFQDRTRRTFRRGACAYVFAEWDEQRVDLDVVARRQHL